MKETLKIKTKNYCSMSEARCKYRELHPIQGASNPFTSTVSNHKSKREKITNSTEITSSNYVSNNKTRALLTNNAHKTTSVQAETFNSQKITQSKTTIPK